MADAPAGTVRLNRLSFYFHSGDRRPGDVSHQLMFKVISTCLTRHTSISLLFDAPGLFCQPFLKRCPVPDPSLHGTVLPYSKFKTRLPSPVCSVPDRLQHFPVRNERKGLGVLDSVPAPGINPKLIGSGCCYTGAAFSFAEFFVVSWSRRFEEPIWLRGSAGRCEKVGTTTFQLSREG